MAATAGSGLLRLWLWLRLRLLRRPRLRLLRLRGYSTSDPRLRQRDRDRLDGDGQRLQLDRRRLEQRRHHRQWLGGRGRLGWRRGARHGRRGRRQPVHAPRRRRVRRRNGHDGRLRLRHVRRPDRHGRRNGLGPTAAWSAPAPPPPNNYDGVPIFGPADRPAGPNAAATRTMTTGASSGPTRSPSAAMPTAR